jgi:hypothetical protein
MTNTEEEKIIGPENDRQRFMLAYIARYEPVSSLSMYYRIKTKLSTYENDIATLQKQGFIVASEDGIPNLTLSEKGRKYMNTASTMEFFNWKYYEREFPVMHWLR